MSARSLGQLEGRKHAHAWLELAPRARLVRMRDRAAEFKGDQDAFYLGMLEGLVSNLAQVDARTQRRNPKRKQRNNPPSYEDFHWGLPVDRIDHYEVEFPDDGAELVALGELVSVTYFTQKGTEEAEYTHDFEDPVPVLTYSPNGLLIIIGGGYRISAEGIIK